MTTLFATATPPHRVFVDESVTGVRWTDGSITWGLDFDANSGEVTLPAEAGEGARTAAGAAVSDAAVSGVPSTLLSLTTTSPGPDGEDGTPGPDVEAVVSVVVLPADAPTASPVSAFTLSGAFGNAADNPARVACAVLFEAFVGGTARARETAPPVLEFAIDPNSGLAHGLAAQIAAQAAGNDAPRPVGAISLSCPLPAFRDANTPPSSPGGETVVFDLCTIEAINPLPQIEVPTRLATQFARLTPPGPGERIDLAILLSCGPCAAPTYLNPSPSWAHTNVCIGTLSLLGPPNAVTFSPAPANQILTPEGGQTLAVSFDPPAPLNVWGTGGGYAVSLVEIEADVDEFNPTLYAAAAGAAAGGGGGGAAARAGLSTGTRAPRPWPAVFHPPARPHLAATQTSFTALSFTLPSFSSPAVIQASLVSELGNVRSPPQYLVLNPSKSATPVLPQIPIRDGSVSVALPSAGLVLHVLGSPSTSGPGPHPPPFVVRNVATGAVASLAPRGVQVGDDTGTVGHTVEFLPTLGKQGIVIVAGGRSVTAPPDGAPLALGAPLDAIYALDIASLTYSRVGSLPLPLTSHASAIVPGPSTFSSVLTQGASLDADGDIASSSDAVVSAQNEHAPSEITFFGGLTATAEAPALVMAPPAIHTFSFAMDPATHPDGATPGTITCVATRSWALPTDLGVDLGRRGHALLALPRPSSSSCGPTYIVIGGTSATLAPPAHGIFLISGESVTLPGRSSSGTPLANIVGHSVSVLPIEFSGASPSLRRIVCSGIDAPISIALVGGARVDHADSGPPLPPAILCIGIGRYFDMNGDPGLVATDGASPVTVLHHHHMAHVGAKAALFGPDLLVFGGETTPRGVQAWSTAGDLSLGQAEQLRIVSASMATASLVQADATPQPWSPSAPSPVGSYDGLDAAHFADPALISADQWDTVPISPAAAEVLIWLRASSSGGGRGGGQNNALVPVLPLSDALDALWLLPFLTQNDGRRSGLAAKIHMDVLASLRPSNIGYAILSLWDRLDATPHIASPEALLIWDLLCSALYLHAPTVLLSQGWAHLTRSRPDLALAFQAHLSNPMGSARPTPVPADAVDPTSQPWY